MQNEKLVLINEKIAAYAEKIIAMKSQAKDLAKKSKADAIKKKRDDERNKKILAGEFLLAEMKSNSVFRIEIEDKLNCSLSKNEDRELFGLPLLESVEIATAASAVTAI